MTRKSQKQLDRAAERRAAKAAKENVQTELEQVAAKVEETRAATEAEIQAELDEQEENDSEGGYTDAQRRSLEDIARIEAAKQTLRSYGLYYTINSDRTADRAACLCGCGQFPAGKKSKFCPGHDAKHASALAEPKAPKVCKCGCGGETKGGNWIPGHDAKYHSRVKKLGKQLEAIIAA